MAHGDVIDKELSRAVYGRIEKEIKKGEKTKSNHDLEKCISEIDFNYYILKRYNCSILPFSNKKFQELDKKVKKLKKNTRLSPYS